MKSKSRPVSLTKIASLVVFVIFVHFSLFGPIGLLKKSDNLKFQYWNIQSIDNMKYSRDLSRQMLSKPEFDKTIDKQISLVAATGATHIALGVPYDSEFLPILKRWVESARKNNLKIWFRGNFSGWEGWFGYKPLTRSEHTKLISSFIISNPDLFQDGDAFSSCPECENGGPGDPRQTGDTEGHRQFLIEESDAVVLAFKQIHKDIQINLNSMNGDVARLIMDKDTTTKLRGVVVIDHYVKDPEKLVADIREISQTSGGKVILGEFGAPIPDIHGDMTESEQAAWLEKLFSLLVHEPSIAGVNYWTGFGGSTELWSDGVTARQAVKTVTNYYHPALTQLTLKTWFGLPVANAAVVIGSRSFTSNLQGIVSVPSNFTGETITVYHPLFKISTIDYRPDALYTITPVSLFAFLKHITSLL